MFLRNLTVIDVQTPNAMNDRICEIGLTMISGQEIVSSQQFGINPETHWDPENIAIHGMRPQDVAEAPALPAVWLYVEPLLRHAIVVAHNAPFDLAVLGKALGSYGIHPKPLRYLDTCALAKKFYPRVPNRKLETLCAMLGIQLTGRSGLAHSIATAELALDMLRKGMGRGDALRWVFEHHLYDKTYIRRR